MLRIVTDSGADYEPHELIEKHIIYVPLYVYFGDKEFQENITISKNGFYEMLQKDKNFPHTSQPSVEAWEKVFQAAEDAGDELVAVCLSSGLSGTYQTASMVAEDYPHCYVVDSLNGTGGERIVCDEALRLRELGKSAREIVEHLEVFRGKVVLYTIMDTLEFLYKGGRISKALYTFGSLGKIKPIMHVTPDGHPDIPYKAIGMRRGMAYLLSRLKEEIPDPFYPLYIMYTYNKSNAIDLQKYLAANGYEVPDERLIPVGAVVGAHIGPDACAIVYVGK